MATSMLVESRVRAATPVSPAPRRRVCEQRPQLFDLPEPAPANLSRGPLSPATGGDEFLTFDDLAAEESASSRFARAAKKAANACKTCPFLQDCQKDAYERIASGQRPQGEVVAAVAFNDQGLPDPAVHDVPRQRELDNLTLDFDLGIAAERVDEYTDWVPADLAPMALADSTAVTMALDEQRVDMTIAQSHLDTNTDTTADGRIVLSYDDEWDVLRRSVDAGISRHRVSQILGCTWQRASEMSFIIGCEAEGAFRASTWVTARARIYQQDVADDQARRDARAAQQRARDVELLRRHAIHAQVQSVAENYSDTPVFRRPRPLSSRIKRGVCVSQRSMKLAAFAGL